MENLSLFNVFFGNGVFSTDYILDLINKKEIIWDNLTEDQIQPNTIDVRIGETKVYPIDKLNENPILYKGEKDEPIILPKGCFAEIKIYDQIRFDKSKYLIDIELRSGRGRLHLFPDCETTFLGINNTNSLKLFNLNINDIVLYGQDRFAQVFFNSQNNTCADGRIINDAKEIKDLAKICGVESIGPYLKINAGNSVFAYKPIGEINTRNKYSDTELFEEHKIPYILKSLKQALVPSKEVITVPENIGIRLLKRFPLVPKQYLTKLDFESYQNIMIMVNSGWVDSGYTGKLNLQPFTNKDFIIDQSTFCLGIVYKYDQKVSKPYAGHYQNTTKILSS